MKNINYFLAIFSRGMSKNNDLACLDYSKFIDCFQFGLRVGLLLVLVHQVDEGVRLVVVDLTKALVRKAQEEELHRLPLHSLQFVDCLDVEQ